MPSVLKKMIIQSLRQKLKKIYFTRMKFKQRNLQGEKPKMTYIIGGKTLLTLKKQVQNNITNILVIVQLWQTTFFINSDSKIRKNMKFIF